MKILILKPKTIVQPKETIDYAKFVKLKFTKPSDIVNKWKTAAKQTIPLNVMTTKHIINSINAFNKGKIPNDYHGGKSKRIKLFNEELINRN